MVQKLPLNNLLGQKSKLNVLRILSLNHELTGREISRRARLSPRAAQQALNQLCQGGVVRRKAAGLSYLYSLNLERHIVKNILLPLFGQENRLFKVSIEELLKRLPLSSVLSLAMFGSVARGERQAPGDLDIFILVKDSADPEKINNLVRAKGREFFDMFGLPIAPYTVCFTDFVQRFDKKDKLIRNIVKEGRLLWGQSFTEVLAFGPKKIAYKTSHRS